MRSRTVVFSQVMELWVAENSAKNMCVSGFTSEKSRYALSAFKYDFILSKYFALNLQKKKMFRVGANGAKT